MKYFANIGCFLIGWNKEILKDCGEASHRQYRKLLSAIFIMMVMWGTIGYCFADRYINIELTILKAFVSLMFMFIVLCVERVIILNRLLYVVTKYNLVNNARAQNCHT